MARVIDIKCPTCSAPLPIPADAATVTCRYCGGTSAVERPGRTIQAPPGQTVVHVPNAAANAAVGRNVAMGMAASLLAVGVATSVSLMRGAPSPSYDTPAASRRPGTPGSSVAAIGDAAAPGVTYSFDDRPMLADINGDGTVDIVGRVREYNIGAWISAFDGTSGAELWRTPVLGKDAEDGYAMRGIAHDRFVAVDALGKVQAFDLKTGGPAWTTLLGEKAESICADENGAIVVQTTDDVRHGLDPQSGKPREAGKPAACAVVWSSGRVESPTQRIIDWPRFEANGLPRLNSVDGISAHRALIPSGPGPRFLLGSKSKGTAVPMAAAVGDKRKILWKEVVPGVDPLTTSNNVTTVEAGFGGGVLVMPYEMKERDQGVRMAGLAADTGVRLWDVQVGSNSPFSGGVVVVGDRIYHALGSILEVRALQTGELQFRIGKP